MSTRQPFGRSPLVIAAALSLVVAIVAELALGNAKGSPSDLRQFVGRFHPLVVHLPVGLFVLVVLAEVATLLPRLRARIDPAVGLALPVVVLSTLAAFVLGHLLAQSGGFPAHALSLHRRLEFVAMLGAALSLAAWAYQAQAPSGRARLAYRALLFGSFAVLSLGAHFGGTLTRGDTYLSKYAPAFLKPMLGGAGRAEAAPQAAPGAAPPSREPLLLADVIQPILQARCVECHGPDKVKGKLRVDSLEALLRGGENGPAIVPGAAQKSALVQRMLLPMNDDERMPPEDKPGPSPAEIELFRFWIDRGATATLRVRDALPPSDARALLEKALSGAPVPPITGNHTPPVPSVMPAADTKLVEPRAPSGLSATAILADKCQKCHGPEKAKGRLRVDSLAALLRGGAEGPALVPGQPGKSLIITRARLPREHDEHMPPPEESQLSARELAVLVAWVQRANAPALDRGTTTAAIAAEPAPQSASEPELTKVSASAASGDQALFSDVIQPLLIEKCAKCHQGEKPKGHFDVSDHARIVKGGTSGPAVVAGDPEKSEIVRRLTLPIASDERMPPPGELQLTSDETELVRRWIALGAGAETRVDSASLPEGARGAVHEQAAQSEESQPSGELPAEAGGCAACAIGGRRSWLSGALPLGLALSLTLALGLRRRRTKAKV